jgi:hypothetical protein
MYVHPDRHNGAGNGGAHSGNGGAHSGNGAGNGVAHHHAEDGKRYAGKGTQWNQKKLFGFIIPDAGRPDIFCHANVTGDQIKNLLRPLQGPPQLLQLTNQTLSSSPAGVKNRACHRKRR